MACFQYNLFHFKKKLLIIAFFFILSFTHEIYFVQGRPATSNAAEGVKGREEEFTGRYLIGSRPPNCAKRCSSCGHCKAIQVPIVPQQKHFKSRDTLNSRGENLSNYKPVSWKCKCGNLIFNP